MEPYDISINPVSNPVSSLDSSLDSGPNLGGQTIKLKAKDDAERVYFKKVDDIAKGLVPMPFLHVIFLRDAFKETHGSDSLLVRQLEIVLELSKIRQIRLIRKVNLAIHGKPNVFRFEITEEMVMLMNQIEEVIDLARLLNVDPSMYLDESTDSDDIEQATNEFCLNHWAVKTDKLISLDYCDNMFDTGDSVRIITGIDSVHWVVVISRKFGPGRNQYAYAGGYVDDGDSIEGAARREREEETEEEIGPSNPGIQVTTREYTLEPYIHSYWDIRAYNAIALKHRIVPKHGALVIWDTYSYVGDSNKKARLSVL